MTIYTPRGLKIRVKTTQAFALMARLFPEIDAFQVLKMTEGIELIPSLFGTIAGLVSFALKLDTMEIALVALLATIIGKLITVYGLFPIIPGLATLSTWYSYLYNFGVYLIVLLISGMLLVGGKGTLMFFAGKLIGHLFNSLLELVECWRMHRLTGWGWTTSERNFWNAYRHFASKLGKDLDFTVTDEELLGKNWMPVFDDFAKKYPDLAEKCTIRD